VMIVHGNNGPWCRDPWWESWESWTAWIFELKVSLIFVEMLTPDRQPLALAIYPTIAA
jgi:hypothetical protein